MGYIVVMIITWDHPKAESNLKKHGISFEEAQSVFFATSSGSPPKVGAPGVSVSHNMLLL